MGRVLGIDFGVKRVGAAVSDPGRSIATPLEVHERKDRAQDARHYKKLVVEHEIDRVVIGLPVHTTGQEGPASARARAWGAWLAEATGLPVVFYDERFTTVMAEEVLLEVDFSRRKRKGMRDMLAARILLQDYLDAGCPESTARPAPLADEDDR